MNSVKINLKNGLTVRVTPLGMSQIGEATELKATNFGDFDLHINKSTQHRVVVRNMGEFLMVIHIWEDFKAKK